MPAESSAEEPIMSREHHRPGGVEYYLDITDRENVSRRSAVALRSGENRQAQKRSKNYEEWGSIHVNTPKCFR
jgi:hypothetical protein